MARERADLVIVGAGTIGGWASVFAREAGLRAVVVLEREQAGSGASGRAAGMVRAQGGMPDTVRLGSWSIGFYGSQRDRYDTDSGFMQRGYVILATSVRGERAAHDRIAMQRAVGLDARWVDVDEIRRLIPAMARDGYRGGSYVATDGWVDPPRNVRAYSLAMQRAGVDLRERTRFVGVRTRTGKRGSGTLTAVETSDGTIATERLVLTGGPELREVGRPLGLRIPAGGARHQVVVSEPHPAFDVERLPMVFDLGAGLYWRLEEGGLLWGMSNPNETPGRARSIDWPYLKTMQRRLARYVPVTKELGIRKAWAATIDYTPDHLPILGPALRPDGSSIDGVTVASPGGHGMMWGPAAARIAADLAIKGRTKVTDVEDFGLDRFDADGKSRFYDPVALPFPVAFDD